MQIMIITHGPLADSFKESARMFFGEQCDTLITIGLYPEDSPEELYNQLNKYVETSVEDEILIFVDIFSGTPFNIVALVVDEYPKLNIQCLTGVNMPLIMETLSMKETISLDELLISLEKNSKNSIVNLKKALELT